MLLSKKIFLITGLAVFSLLTMDSCKKDQSANSVNAGSQSIVDASGDESTLESTFNDVYDNAAGIDSATAGESLGMYGNNGAGVFGAAAFNSVGEMTNAPQTRCFTLTIIPQQRGVFPKTVTIDFGAGCEHNGHTRMGKIITVYSGPLFIPGSQAVTTFEGYAIDSFTVEGKHTITNLTDTGANQRSVRVVVENAKVTNTANGNWRTWNSDRTRTQVEGNGTPLYPLDDVYNITGDRSGSNSQGRTWSGQTVEPLVRKSVCPWLVKGIVNLTVNGRSGVLDYGDGTCDNQATITVNAVPKTITLH